MRVCSIIFCSNKHKAKGFCDNHYQQAKNGLKKPWLNEMPIKKEQKNCSLEDCKNKVRSRGFCRKHRDELVLKYTLKLCLNNCNRLAAIKDLCHSCYRKQTLPKDYSRRYFLENKDRYKKASGKFLKSKKGKDHNKFFNHLYRFRIQKACPFWVDLKELKIVIEKCPNNLTLDHIIPLKHKYVCGLHVPWNLQYLTKSQNSQKSNKFDFSNSNNSWRLDDQEFNLSKGK